jgi:putrescine transport system substrate-binding protein
MRQTRFVMGLIALCLSAACGKPRSESQPAQPTANGADEKVLNLYIWADYMAPDTIATFEKNSGLKVNVSYFDSDETLEGRVLTGHSGFDVVVPPANFMHREIRSGAYQPLDKTKLPNIVNFDPDLMSRVAVNDPENAHAVV